MSEWLQHPAPQPEETDELEEVAEDPEPEARVDPDLDPGAESYLDNAPDPEAPLDGGTPA